MSVYLNTYETWQEYGGNEEGGWWYQCGNPIESVLITDQDFYEYINNEDNQEQRNELIQSAINKFKTGPTKPKETGYGGYIFIIGCDQPSRYEQDNNFSAFFEEEYAKPYPITKPHYE